MAHSHDRTLLASLGFADPDKNDRRHTLACQYLCEPDVARKVLEVVHGPEKLDFSTVKPSLLADESYPEERLSLGSIGTEVAVRGRNNFLIGFWDVVLCLDLTVFSWRKRYVKDSVPQWMAERWYGEWRVTPKEGHGLLEKPMPESGEHVSDGHDFSDKRDIVRYGHAACLPDGQPDFSKYYGTISADGYRRCCTRSRDYKKVTIEVKAGKTDVANIIRQIETYGKDHPCVAATCYPLTPTDKATLAQAGIKHIYLNKGFQEYCLRREQEKPVEEDGL